MNKNIKFIFLFSIIFYSSLISFGQNQLSGAIVDFNTKKMLNGIFVKLVDTDSNKIIFSVKSNKFGYFIIDNIPNGNYLFLIENPYYQIYSNDLKIIDNIDLEKIYITPIEKLDEVVIKATKKMLQYTAIGNKLNVEGTILAKEDSAMDVLKFSPTVSTNNGISVLGSGNVMIKLNNNELKLQGKALIAFLESLDADNIKSIEITDKKTADMDAEIEAVINIFLKKDIGTSVNYFGFITSTKDKYRGWLSDISIYHRRDKYKILSNIYLSQSKYHNEKEETLIFDNDIEHNINVNRNNLRRERFLDFEIDYLKDSLSTYSFLYNYGKNDEDDIKAIETNHITTNIVNDSIITTESEAAYLENSHTFSLFFNKVKDTLGSNFNITSSYSVNNESSPLLQNRNYYRSNILLFKENIRQSQDVSNAVISIKTEYKKVFTNDNSLKFGIKISSVGYKNKEYLENYILNNWIQNIEGTDDFYFNQNIGAVYGSYSFNKEKYSLYFGLRDEFTYNSFSFNSQDYNNTNFNNILPSITYKRIFNKNNLFYLFSNTNIRRPSYFSFNPNTSFFSSTNNFRGNPDIKPYVNYNFGTQYLFKRKYVVNLKYSFSDNLIIRKPVYNDETGITTVSPINEGKSKKILLHMSIPIKVSKKWNIQNRLTGGFSNYKILDKEYNSHFGTISTINSIELPKGMKLSFDMFYNTASQRGYYNFKDNFNSNIKLNIPLFKEKAILGFQIRDIFNTSSTNYSYIVNDIRANYYSKNDTQRFFIRFSYSFQTGKEIDKETKESIIEDEKNRMGNVKR